MYKKETLNGVEYHFDGSKFSSAAEYVASMADINIGNGESSDQILTHATISGKVWHNIPRSGAANYGMTTQQFDSAIAEQKEKEFFDSEKQKAQRIFFDFTFGLGEYQIIPMEMDQVKAYIQSIDPSRVNVRGAVRNLPRPDIFSRYD